MNLAVLWLALAATAVVILIASQFLARSADVIAIKTGLGRSFIGVVMLATATSLPELGTGVSSIVLVGTPDLAAGDAFGSNVFNLLIIGVLDLTWRNGPILTAVSRTSVVIAALGVVAITLGAGAIIIHQATGTISSWPISPLSVMLLLVFLGGMFLIYHHNDAGDIEGPDTPEYAGHGLAGAFSTYGAAAGVVVAAAIGLAFIGDRLADEMGWEASFVGTQFLALSTSLPELATSYAALRIGAPELAITNVLGSNLFNMGLVLFVDDAVYTDGVLWSTVSEVHALTAVVAVFMTAIVIVGLMFRDRRRPHRFFTWEAIALVGMYLAASVLVFGLA